MISPSNEIWDKKQVINFPDLHILTILVLCKLKTCESDKIICPLSQYCLHSVTFIIKNEEMIKIIMIIAKSIKIYSSLAQSHDYKIWDNWVNGVKH